MNIVFYSNNSNYFDKANFLIKTLPTWREQFDLLQKNHPKDTFFAVTQAPGMFLPSDDENLFKENIIYYDTDDTEEIASIIKNLNPDIVIALSFWTVPYDWLPVKDSLIAEHLRASGIKVICHPLEATMACFNKHDTHTFLEKAGINCAKALFVNHDLYFSADSKKEVRYNVYKEAVLKELSKMTLPLIIKDPLGLSSYGMQVLNTIGEARAYLNSRKNNSDRLIEEYITGTQFGCEIYRNNGKCFILPPFMFSVNQYGITSPKQSVKFGPFCSKKDYDDYKLNDLYKMLSILAEKLNLCGAAQVDLVFDGEKWFVIEINPRLSGMTTSYWCACKKIYWSSPNMTSSQKDMTGELNFYDFILSMLSVYSEKTTNVIPESKACVIPMLDTEIYSYTLNIKFPLLSKSDFEKLSKQNGIRFICQTEDKAARQERETGYCEVIICRETKQGLLETLSQLEKDFPEIIEPQFFETARKMIIKNI